MFRLVAFVLVLVATSPGALALTLPSAGEVGPVAVGPDGLAAEGEPYYVRVEQSRPESPTVANRTADCASDKRPATPVEGATSIAEPLRAWDPTTQPSAASWFPRCTPTGTVRPCAPIGPCPAQAYASYDFPTGRYYVEFTQSVVSLPVGGPLSGQATTIGITGTSGAGTTADCETCPSPP